MKRYKLHTVTFNTCESEKRSEVGYNYGKNDQITISLSIYLLTYLSVRVLKEVL